MATTGEKYRARQKQEAERIRAICADMIDEMGPVLNRYEAKPRIQTALIVQLIAGWVLACRRSPGAADVPWLEFSVFVMDQLFDQARKEIDRQWLLRERAWPEEPEWR